MKFGVYNAILHDRSLPEAIKVIAGLGLTGIELNSGGFLPAVHIPTFDDILTSDGARDEFLGQFEGTGVEIGGLNCNGNPLHPDPVIGTKHAEDIRRSIRLANRLGQHRVVTMSGLPAGEPGGKRPNWIVNAWNSGALDVLDHQWERHREVLAGDRPRGGGSGREGRPRAAPAEHRVQPGRHPRAGRAHRSHPCRGRAGCFAPVLAVDGPGGRGPGPRTAGVPRRRQGREDQPVRRGVRRTRQPLPPAGDRTRRGPTSAATSGPTSGPRKQPGTSSPSAAATTPSTGPPGSPPWPRSIPTCGSTSSTRTSASARSRAWRRRRRCSSTPPAVPAWVRTETPPAPLGLRRNWCGRHQEPRVS